MATRVYRIGTIYSRVDGLIRKGHLKEIDKPVWFDVYKNFPPKCAPTFKRTVSDTQLRVIFYEEDKLRAKIHKTFKSKLGLIDLNDNKQLLCESLLKTYQQYIAEGLTENEAIEKLKDILKSTPPEVEKEEREEEGNLENVEKTIFEKPSIDISTDMNVLRV